MQRILSIEAASRSCNSGSEVVSKRLCFSCSLSIAFLALIGGFVLGQYTTEQILKKRQLAIDKTTSSSTTSTNNNVAVIKHLLCQSLSNVKFDNVSTNNLSNNNLSINSSSLSNLSIDNDEKFIPIDNLRHCNVILTDCNRLSSNRSFKVRELKEHLLIYAKEMANCLQELND